jgi:hypothetical protein
MRRTPRTLLALSLALPLLGATPPRVPFRDQKFEPTTRLQVLYDGTNHYLMVDPDLSTDNVLYGDGKAFWQQRVPTFGGEKDGAGRWSERILTFWDPRARTPHDASLEYRGGKYTVICGRREIAFTPLYEAHAQAILASAKLYKPHWQHRPHALGRDDAGVYYYVDQGNDPETENLFRLFVGPKGDLKEAKPIKVTNDDAAELFATKSGTLRLDFMNGEYSWNDKAGKHRLSTLPLEESRMLIYVDLGVYAGQKLGTPCDDL